MGGKSCLQVHFESRGEKTTTWMILVAEILVLAENDYFGVSLGGVLGPPGPPEYILVGSYKRQILPTKSTSSQERKKRPPG